MVSLDESGIVRKERLFAIGLLCFVIVFTICDVYEDLNNGSSSDHVMGEVFVIALCLVTCVYLWHRVVEAWKDTSSNFKAQLSAVRDDANKWKEAHGTLSKGLSAAITAQLSDWGLSSAEKDITFLLMKGLSFKEISVIRKTSEHTVRQQAATVYRKSGLEGRSQLSAFFLEDLLAVHAPETSAM